jgi:hypothetical protein
MPPLGLFGTGFSASNIENELANAVWERHLSEPYVILSSLFASSVGRNSWVMSITFSREVYSTTVFRWTTIFGSVSL